MRIYLIGYMGVGKSTIGNKIAANLKLRFIDLDDFIVQSRGKSIESIFKEEAEEAFRDYETESLKKVSESENFVLATGGGTPCFNENMNLMKGSGTTVYLQAETDYLVTQLTISTTIRPLIQGKSKDELFEFIAKNLKEREEYYLQSRFTIDATKKDIVEELEMLLNKNSSC